MTDAGLSPTPPPGSARDDVFGDSAAVVQRYVELLASVGIEWGLLGPREVPRLWERHIFNSVAHRQLMPAGARVVDVGSGAGLPGIPLALARPDLTVTLLEPLERRCEFLTLAVQELSLGDRVSIQRARSEDTDDVFDVVTGRAVAPLVRLIRDSWPLVGDGGVLLALKGASVDKELRAASADLRRQRLMADVVVVQAHPRTESTRVVRIRAAR